MKTDFEAYLKIEKGYAAATHKAYLRDVQDLADFLWEKEKISLFDAEHLPKVQYRSLRNWVASLKKNNLSHKSIRRKAAAANTYFEFAKQRKILSQNPVSKLQLPKTEKKVTVFLKENETAFLFNEIDFPDTFEGNRDKCILEVLYGCGIRRNELIALQSKDIDFSNKIIRVTGKGNKTRIVPFGKHVFTSMENYKKKCFELNLNLDNDFFVNRKNKPLYENLVYRICKKYISLVSHSHQHGAHVFRHTYATHLLNAGADLNDIKTLLGHSSLAATQIYTHNSLNKLKNVHNLAHPRAKKNEPERLEMNEEMKE